MCYPSVGREPQKHFHIIKREKEKAREIERDSERDSEREKMRSFWYPEFRWRMDVFVLSGGGVSISLYNVSAIDHSRPQHFS